MSDSNSTNFTNTSTFILLGIPGLDGAHVWIFIPFCTMYIIALLGNFTILFIVKTEQSLHAPMYYFFCMLAVADLILCTSTMPKILAIFWFNSREIDFSACLTQMYFIHCLSAMESAVFVAMAFDHYVAICHPLRHSTIVELHCDQDWPDHDATSWHDCTSLSLPGEAVAILQNQHHPPAVLSAYSHGESGLRRHPHNYGLFVLFCVMGLDVIFIVMSYIQILRTIFSLSTEDARFTTSGTCGSHLFVISAFYIPGLFISLMYRFGQNVPLQFHVLIANVYLLMPPMLNPIIYGVRTKQIRDQLLQLFSHEGA